ncbi:interleukin-6 receptor subunit beta isoform X2 [Leuresthes tenuis]|uniref:interleukin-6 receptor subunit beta isoform X2 n=1 Tax=Leuresthes tenuis TaxID=355514 RepID=UPI003B50B5FA
MDLWSLCWTLMICLSAFSLEVTVRHTQLKRCEESERMCVSNLRDCAAPPLSSVQKPLNMDCYYQSSADGIRSVTCGWSQEADTHTESEASLIFTSRDTILSCRGIFNPAAVLNVTARIKNYMMGTEIWSQPHTVFLHGAVKPSQPVLTVVGSTEDSLVVSWRSSSDGSCRLRFRPNSSGTWTQVPDSVPARADQKLSYTFTDLLPFTVYSAAVACRGESGIWSDWSSDTSGKTVDRVPSRPSDMCYRVEKTGSGSLLLQLLWKPESRVLGYELNVEPDGKIQNVTEATALLVVQEGNCSVTVRAFNMAGYGPAARLHINTPTQITLPSTKNLWISSSYPVHKALLVQWMMPTTPPSALPLSHVAVQWRSEKNASTSHWSRVDGYATSAAIRGVEPDESYLVSVFPVYNQMCGSPQSLAASLHQGALMEVVSLNVVSVTKTAVTIRWVWQRKSGPIRVSRYSMMLRRDSHRQTLGLWLDQWQHTFLHLTPNTEYSLLLLADNVSRNIISVTTDLDEVPVVTALLLLAVTVVMVSILSRLVYKFYFFPPISSPRRSSTGRWLMDPNRKSCAKRRILDIKDFQVRDVLGEKSLIIVAPNDQFPSEELSEEASVSSSIILQLSPRWLDTVCVCDPFPATEQELGSLQAQQGSVFLPEASREADAALRDADNSSFPQKDQVYRVSPQSELAVTSELQDLLANSRCVYQMNNLALLRSPDAQAAGQADCSYLIYEYLSNGCFRTEIAEEGETCNTSAA